MPNYEYACQNVDCAEVYEINVPIDDRDKPTDEPCPLCGAEVKRCHAAPGIGRNGGNMMKKVPSGFKEVIAKVKERTPFSRYDKTPLQITKY